MTTGDFDILELGHLFGRGKRWKTPRRMGINKFDFEGVRMVAERGIDGGRER
jgi:hypothetical protein